MKSSQKRNGTKLITPKRRNVTAVVLRKDGKMLLQLRDDGRGKNIMYPNTWCFPGGGCELHETYTDALRRELKEEYGLNIGTQCKLLTKYDFGGYIDDHVFICRIDFLPKLYLNEGDGLQWAFLKDIKKMHLAWRQKKFIPELEKYLKKTWI